jgi:hypothetical protein
METDKKDMAQDKAVVKKAFKMHDAQEHKGEHTNLSKLKKGGMMNMKMKAKKFAAGGITKEMPTSKAMGNMGMAEGGKVKKLAMGGLGTMPMARPGVAPMYGAPAMAPAPMGMAPTYKKGGKVKPKMACSGGKMASGGSFRTSANGVASKGKTKGTQVKMYAKGGSVSPDGIAQHGKTRAPGFR